MDKATELLKRIQPYMNDFNFPLGLTDDVNAFLLGGGKYCVYTKI
jgi:hypothetical protein